MRVRNIAATVLISAGTALVSAYVYGKYADNKDYKGIPYASGLQIPVNYVSFSGNKEPSAGMTNFEDAASISAPATVHIMTRTKSRQITNDLQGGNTPLDNLFGNNNPFSQFFGHGGGHYYIPGQRAAGSGVLISSDGYIVTCNHVVDGADQVTVTLNNRETYKAKVVGRDANTDLAVLKINEHHLPYLLFGNSDNVKLGQWVLAVGYPLNLETTVTAGIVSAKSRDIGVNNDGVDPVESFIQTDAAVNPGNSGGALVNTQGQLIGITSAIASPTGSFAGYAYAIPVNMVKKVVNDILKYGTVQRAFLGVELPNLLNPAYQASLSNALPENGVRINGVEPQGAAEAAGMKSGDIITQVDGETINSQPELMEKIASYRPGDKVTIVYLRNGQQNTVSVVLRNKNGNTSIVRTTVLDELGANFQTLSQADASKLGISGGVQVDNIGSGIIREQTDMQPGFIITKVGKYPVTDMNSLREGIEKQNGNVQIEGIYPDQDGVFYYGLNNIHPQSN
ncbi:MAG TPA: trypsin-like peptidase domain-containing protein [Chitinophagaceae bacterium]|nr:trypsin-like peptidase domain-containing protein [Chitinophagaceae bacterium]